MLKKIYRVEEFSSWPYKKVVGVEVANAENKIIVNTDFTMKKYRIYYRYPSQFVDFSFIEPFFDCSDVRIADCNVNDNIGIEIDYNVFYSCDKADQERLEGLRESLIQNGTDIVDVPEYLKPDSYKIGDLDSPYYSWHYSYNVEELMKKRMKALFVSSHSDLPMLNGHTIPEEAKDDEYAGVQVVTYELYEELPTYSDLLDNMKIYCQWFGSLSIV